MILFLVRRILSAIPVLLVVSLMTFVIMWLVPGDVSAEIGGTDATPEQIQQIREQLGIDRPLIERAANWYGNLLRGDLGHSYLLNRSVVDAVIERVPITLSLAGLALFMATIIGTLLGVFAAVRHNTWFDQGAMVPERPDHLDAVLEPEPDAERDGVADDRANHGCGIDLPERQFPLRDQPAGKQQHRRRGHEDPQDEHRFPRRDQEDEQQRKPEIAGNAIEKRLDPAGCESDQVRHGILLPGGR